MSNTTTERAFTGNLDALPNGVSIDAIENLLDAGTTDKRAYAVACRDAGLSNADGGASMEAVYGSATKSGGFGNLVTGGLRDVGRSGEVDAAPRGGGVKVTSFAAYVANYRKTMEAKRDALVKAALAATEAASNVDADALVAAEGERLDKVISEAKATKVALGKDSAAFVAAATERLRHAADAATTAHDEGVLLIDAELAEAGVAPLAQGEGEGDAAA